MTYCFVRFPGVPGSPGGPPGPVLGRSREGSEKVQRRLEKVGGGQRRLDKVRESVNKKVRENEIKIGKNR